MSEVVSKKRGPRPNARQVIPESVKVAALVTADTNPDPNKTKEQIAHEHGMSRATLATVKYDRLSPEGKALYDRKKAELSELAFDVTLKALRKSSELIDRSDDPKYLQGIAAAGKFADNVHRLETGQATQITKNTVTVEQHALEFIKMLLGKVNGDIITALEMFRRTSLEPLIPNHRRDDIAARIESGELKLLTE